MGMKREFNNSKQKSQHFFLAVPTPIVNKVLTVIVVVKKGSYFLGRRIHSRRRCATDNQWRKHPRMWLQHINGQLSIQYFIFIKIITQCYLPSMVTNHTLISKLPYTSSDACYTGNKSGTAAINNCQWSKNFFTELC